MKTEIRSRSKEILRAMDREQILKKSRLIAKNISALLHEISQQSNESICIGTFSPIAGEVLWFENFTVDAKIEFAVAHIEDESRIGFYSIELDEIKKGKVDIILEEQYLTKPVVPDLLLIPGLAFTKDCHRMGRGKGYYDRYLENFTGRKWGICFEAQVFEQIPVEEFDIPMNMVITEENIYKKG